MNIRQMVQRKSFDAIDLRDFIGEESMPVTIDKVDYKTLKARDFGKPEIAWYMFVCELLKPIKISPTAIYQIADILGSEETDDWVGRVIGIKAIEIDVYDKRVWVVNFWNVGDRRPMLPLKTDLSGYSSWTEGQRAALNRLLPPASGSSPSHRPADEGKDAASAPMGAKTAAGIIVALRERGLDWGDLEADCRRGECHELIDGMMPAACPIALAQRARVYCGLNPVVNSVDDKTRKAEIEKIVGGWEPPASTETPSAGGEVINEQTGEVTAAPAGPPVTDDDIPF